MAVNIDEFKKDLDLLKNQRSVIQAKLDEANRHVAELMETLKGMGFNSVEEAKQAYVQQLSEAEKQHALVKQLMGEIVNVDNTIPSRESVMEKLNALSAGNYNLSSPENPIVQNVVPVVEQPLVQQNVTPIESPVQPVTQTPVENITQPVTTSANDFIQQNVIPPAVPTPDQSSVVPTDQNGTVDLSNMLFASL